jgi:hypothetical protein
MMTAKQRVRASIEHRQPDQLPMDFGGCFITGIHCSVVEQLRDEYGLEKHPVKVCEPYQMLGLVEDDLKDVMGIDIESIFPNRTIFGFANENWKEYHTWWDQTVLISEHFQTQERADGTTVFPKGDRNVAPSGHMPKTSYFFDTIVRPQDYDEDDLKLEENLEEFGPMNAEEAAYWEREAARVRGGDRAVITHLNGTSLGDIALVPAPFLTNPKGVRGIEDWYMLLASDPEFVFQLFERQTEIALDNMAKLNNIAGDVLDVVVVCGTDFGTQESTFCSVDTFHELWLPHYRRINDWIHANTAWKTFKHSCGAIDTLIPGIIEAGFDILNPVQCSAKGMEADGLKQRYGDQICFWGGGVNTQQTLPFGTPEQVRDEVLVRCETFAPGGGFVFHAIPNVPALSPVNTVIARGEAVKAYNQKQ